MRHSLITILIAIASFALPSTSRAQPAGELSGSVRDQTGAPLAGVRVVVRDPQGRQTEMMANGEFTFPALAPGNYHVSAELRGFERASRNVQVRSDERATVSLTLRLMLVEDTVVTAEKVGERDVRTVPMAVSAVSAVELERLGVSTVDQAAALAPSTTFTQNSSFGQLSIRGIGTNVVYAGADPSSAMYLDGVYLARPAMAFVEFLDLDRLEVVRGPQGTLYGRNVVGGAMNLVSRPPTSQFEGAARLTTGNRGALRAEVQASGPLKRDRLMGRVAFMRGVEDGYVRDLEHPDHPLGGDDVTAAKGQLRVVADRRTSLLVSMDLSDQRGAPLAFNKVLAVKPGFEVDNPADLREVRTSIPGEQRLRQYGGSLRLTSTLAPSTTLASLTAFRALEYSFSVDSDITELDISTFDQAESQHQISEELTITREQERLTWVAGVFLFNESDDQMLLSPQQPTQVEIRLLPRVDATSRAVFGQTTVGLTPTLSATVGLRYTRETKEIQNAGGLYQLDNPDSAVPSSVYSYSDEIAHTAWTPKFGLEFELPGGALSYLSATRGFKSGGFNVSSNAPGRGFAPEFAWSYEGGLKGLLLDGRSRYAVSAFAMNYTDLQVQTTIRPGIYDISNAATATVRGVEVENITRLAHGVEVGGHLTWLDAIYDQYVAVAVGGATGDVSGNRLNNAPEWAGRLWAEWSRDVGRSRRVSVTVDATAQSTVFYTPFNDDIQRQRPYGLFGSRIEYGPVDRRWAVAVYARNLTNTDYIMATFGSSQAAFGGRPGPPRQVAVDLTLRR